VQLLSCAIPVVVAFSFVGCGPKVVSNPKSEAEISFYSGTDPVAVGSALSVMVTWSGWCHRPSIGVEGGDNDGEMPCNPVAHTVAFRCEDDACTWKSTGSTGYQLVPTKPGIVHAFAIVTATASGIARTYPLDPIEVVVPDAARMGCSHMGDSMLVSIELTNAGRAVQASAPSLDVNGASCTYNTPLAVDQLSAPMTSLDYMCPGTPREARAEISTPSYQLRVAATCAI
jgi:hypothetical protein